VSARRVHSRVAAFSACLLLIAANGCKKKAPDQALAPQAPDKALAPPPAAEAPKPAQAKAVLIGSVRLASGHDLPSYSPEQMERSVLAHVKGGTFPDICTPPKIADRIPVRQTADGKLIGVMLAASEFSHQTSPGAPKVHEIDIKDCRLTPPLVVARVNDVLHVKNLVKFPLFPGLGSDSFNQSLSFDQARDIPLDTGGVKIMTCGFTAPCGRTDVIVLAHPYFAVTDEQGEFRIDDFPADETVRINAWHPLFSEVFETVRVAHGETKRVELVLTPVPPPPPPPPPPPAPDKNAKGPKLIIPD
jgi:hypothetical protein